MIKLSAVRLISGALSTLSTSTVNKLYHSSLVLHSIVAKAHNRIPVLDKTHVHQIELVVFVGNVKKTTT